MPARITLSFLFVLLIAFPAAVRSDPASSAHSAFYFADRKEWHEARAHAAQSGDRVLAALIDWMYALDPTSGASFRDIAAFLERNPHWPEARRLALRAEQSLAMSYVDDGALRDWFAQHPPISGAGKLAYAESLDAMEGSRVKELIKAAWRQGDFSPVDEQRILQRYASILTRQDHIARAERLLWEEKTSPAERMLPQLTADYQALTRARIALLRNDKKGPSLLNQVPSARRNDPGLIFARLVWRARRGDDAGVVEMLNKAPEDPTHAEAWWYYREPQIRRAIDEGNYRLAEKLLRHHGLTEGTDYAEAVWLKGWLRLEYLKDPQEAYLQFHHMYEGVTYAISKARAAYWAARAAEKMGEGDVAQGWYQTASHYPATFYGQLAYLKLHGPVPLALSDGNAMPEGDYDQFKRSEFGRAIILCTEADRLDVATQFIRHVVDSSKEPGKLEQVAALAREYHNTALGVRAAKRALQHNILVMESGYPTPHYGQVDIELPLAYAIIRQESEFDRLARSRSNALGLMQLLPGTAKETAKKNDLPYAEQRLFEPAYNVQLGSLYLGRLLESFGGSYVKAIAGYNAGPRRVREWEAQFGMPGNSVEEVVNWIEKIPYAETRNYVHRVLENLQIYRHVLENEENRRLRLDADLLY